VAPAVAARYWGALAATNMVGHVLRTVQVEAAERALSLYRVLGQPRRILSSLINLSRHLSAQRQDATAQAALEEARGLIRPDWPVELHHRLLHRDGSIARNAGRFSAALALCHEAVRVGASTGDWRLEAISSNNLVDLLWELGPIDEAARVASKLAEAFRVKPAADGDMAILFANLIGILSEMGRIDEASAVAREALPLMRRARYTYLEEWVYLFWRRGQFDAATRLLGASDAERVRFDTPLQENERRLIAEARPALEARCAPDAFTGALAAGAMLDMTGLFALISEALAQRDGNA
jgi:tetratricopeptide (TPR) repeat protein